MYAPPRFCTQLWALQRYFCLFVILNGLESTTLKPIYWFWASGVFCLLVPFAFTLIQTAIECYREETTDVKRPEAWSSGPVKDGLVVCVFP